MNKPADTEDNLKKEIEELKNKRECFHKRELLKAKLKGYSLAKSETLNEIKKWLKLCPTCSARLSQYKSDLQQELEFLEDKRIILDTLEFKGTDAEIVREEIQERINLIKKELEEIGE